MFTINFDPVALEIFSLEIRWYSLAYIFGILLGWWLAKRIIETNRIMDLKTNTFEARPTTRPRLGTKHPKKEH